MEIYKDIPNYEGLYQVSNLGNVKSLERKVKEVRGFRKIKEKILKQSKSGSGYLQVNLYKNKIPKRYSVHQLVAIAFLNHIPNGYKIVVNHIDLNRINNNVNNLELITQRDNANFKHIKTTSKYIGVCWHKRSKRWRSRITINGKLINLGNFTKEYDAHLAYQKALKEINNDRRTIT